VSEEEIEQLKACLRAGLTVLMRVDTASANPGGLNIWTTGYQSVHCIGYHEDEPVAWYGDKGHCAALWVCDRNDFITAHLINWPKPDCTKQSVAETQETT
jgi:hypothetical protein